MRKTLSFTETAILIMTLAIGLFFFMSSRMMISNSPLKFEQSYEMPRPQSWFRQYFSLMGREISQLYNNPFAKKTQPTAPVQYRNVQTPPPPVNKAVQAKADAAKAAAKKGSLSVSVVETQTAPKLSDSFSGVENNEEEIATDISVPMEADPTEVTPKKVKKILTREQWETRLMSDNSLKGITAFAKAYLKGQVPAATFYSVIEELLKNQDQFKAGLGVYGLGLTPSAKSFEVLAKSISTLPENTQQQASLTINTYGDVKKFGILQQTLKHEEEVVQMTTIQVLDFSIKALSTTVADTNNQRELASAGAYKNYEVFIPQLTQMSEQSPFPSIKEASQVLLKQIESLPK